jgi:hypothetical protein
MLSLSHFVLSLRSYAQNAPSPSGTKPQVKQMLDWRCARGKRRKYSSKKKNGLLGRIKLVRLRIKMKLFHQEEKN